MLGKLAICVEQLQCFAASCFLIHWQFGHFQLIFSPQLWSYPALKAGKNWQEKASLYASYFFLSFMTSFDTVWTFKSLIDYYYPALFPLKIVSPEIYESFGPNMGPLAILVGSRASLLRFFVLYFYMIVLGLIQERLCCFVGELKEVGFWEFALNFLTLLYNRKILDRKTRKKPG